MVQRSVQNVKNSLKFKANPKGNILSIRVGVKKYSVPIEARMLCNGEYLFLSFPASSELYSIDGKTLKPMEAAADASQAYGALNPGKKRGRRRRQAAPMPPELEAALSHIPAGYKLGYAADGKPKLVRMRTRRKSS